MTNAAMALAVIALLLIGLVVLQVESVGTSLESVRLRLDSVVSNINADRLDFARTVTVTATLTLTQTREASSPLPAQLNITELFERVKHSIVVVRVYGRFSSGIGSGFVYDDQGHIITNQHVVSDAVSVYVDFLDRTTLPARVVGFDIDTDLAVVKVNPPAGMTLSPLFLGDSKSLRIGDLVIAIGNPFGLQGSVTVGIVSQKGRLLPSGRGYLIPGVIQIDATINPGNSGGPLLNTKGEVIGVTTAIETTTGTFAGVGYAIPSSIVKRVVPELIAKGSFSHSYIGISGKEINSMVAQQLGLPFKMGLLIETVSPNSPASAAGLRGGSRSVNIAGESYLVGGDLMVAVNGQPIASLDDLLNYLIENTSPGDRVRFTIYRDGQVRNVEVVLGVRP
ncbi:MAG: trypsin-like peptidase domain-containing protein [Thaumarchaeota archaeon]|nr:trypsin-like peptidase domain-containing protein [Candidatus Calditenuaceae archaeon]MDW8187205.1 trypsin-like peptidase domain-containing protein [Nitrososphaerota archaeon]